MIEMRKIRMRSGEEEEAGRQKAGKPERARQACR